MARSYKMLGDYYTRPATLEKARRAFEKSVQMWTDIERRDPGGQNLLDLELSRIGLGGVLGRMHELAAARRLLEPAIGRIEELRRQRTVHSIARFALAAAKNHLANVSYQERQRETAIALLRESAGIHAKLAEDFPQTLEHKHNHVGVLRTLAQVVGERPDAMDAAVEIVERGLQITRRAAQQSPSSFFSRHLIARLLQQRAALTARAPNTTNAQKAAGFRAAAQHLARLAERQPGSELFHSWLADARHKEAEFEHRGGNQAAALDSIRAAIAAKERAVEIHPKGNHEPGLLGMRRFLKGIEGAQTDRATTRKNR